MGALATTDGCSPPTPGLGVYHLWWAVIPAFACWTRGEALCQTIYLPQDEMVNPNNISVVGAGAGLGVGGAAPDLSCLAIKGAVHSCLLSLICLVGLVGK